MRPAESLSRIRVFTRRLSRLKLSTVFLVEASKHCHQPIRRGLNHGHLEYFQTHVRTSRTAQLDAPRFLDERASARRVSPDERDLATLARGCLSAIGRSPALLAWPGGLKPPTRSARCREGNSRPLPAGGAFEGTRHSSAEGAHHDRHHVFAASEPV